MRTSYLRNASAFAVALIAIIFLALPLSAVSQSDDWQLGRYSLLRSEPSSGPLLQKSSGRSSLLRYSFVGKVGGVAFEGVAVRAPSLQGKQLSLSYDSKRPDGQRLIIALGGKNYIQRIYDWMLLPTINYANSEYNAVVSLFGEKTTKNTYDIVYHPAFQNTLLGMRLLQADILLFDLGQTWKLPKLGSNMILGRGESAPQSLKHEVAAALDAIIARESFQSWVMTDHGEPVTVELKGGKLLLHGSPYYFFWVADFQGYEREIEKLKREAAKAKAEGNVMRHNQIVATANSLEPKVEEVQLITQGLQQNRRLLQDFNPPVYGAATMVMRYSALFRLIKSENDENWEAFLASTRGVPVTPSVQTPTRWSRQ